MVFEVISGLFLLILDFLFAFNVFFDSFLMLKLIHLALLFGLLFLGLFLVHLAFELLSVGHLLIVFSLSLLVCQRRVHFCNLVLDQLVSIVVKPWTSIGIGLRYNSLLFKRSAALLHRQTLVHAHRHSNWSPGRLADYGSGLFRSHGGLESWVELVSISLYLVYFLVQIQQHSVVVSNVVVGAHLLGLVLV